MWATLSGRLAQYYMRYGTLNDIMHKVGMLLHTADDKTHNDCIGLLIDKGYTIQMSVTVMMIWVRLYEAKFTPGNLRNYGKWYDMYGQYITMDVEKAKTDEDKIIIQEVQRLVKMPSHILYESFRQR